MARKRKAKNAVRAARGEPVEPVRPQVASADATQAPDWLAKGEAELRHLLLPLSPGERQYPWLTKYEAELQRLVSFLDLSQGFTLGLAECNFAPLRRQLISEIQRKCQLLPLAFELIDFTARTDVISPKSEIIKELHRRPINAPGTKLVVMVCGLESSVRIADRYPAALVDLNLSRDAFPRDVPHPLVLWLPDYLLTTLSRVAIDFWSWRSGTFHFPAPTLLRERILGETVRTGLGVLDVDAQGKQNRIHTLEVLLQEYLPSVGEPSSDDQWAALEILHELMLGHLAIGHAQQVIEYGERALKLTRVLRDRRAESMVLGNLGIAYRFLGQYQRAIECHERALAIAQEIGYRRGEGVALTNLGGIYFSSLGEAQKAIGYFTQTLRIAREIGDKKLAGQALDCLGSAYNSLDQYQRAIKYQEQALAIAREIGDKRLEGAALSSLGLTHDLLGQYLKAIECHEQALVIARELGDRRSEASTHYGLGLTLEEIGRADQAASEFQQALILYETLELDLDAQNVRESLRELGA